MVAPIRTALVLMVLAVVLAHGQPTVSDQSSSGFGVFAAETGGAFLGELAASAGMMVIVMAGGAAAGMNPYDESSAPLGIVWAVSLVPALPAGSAAGACLVGKHYREEGKFWGAALGCVAGVGAGGVLVFAGANLSRLSLVAGIPFLAAAAVSPAAGTTIGYRLTRPQGGIGARIEPGTVTVGTAYASGGRRCPSLNVRLVSVRF